MDCQIRLANWRAAMEGGKKPLRWSGHHQDTTPAATTTTKLYVNQNFSYLSQPPKPGSSCNSLVINNIKTEQRLFVVGRQLMQLVEPPAQHRFHLAAQPAWNKRAEAGCARIKAILRIYLKLLNAGPLELHLQSSCSQVLQLRQQVLHYIESLPGYCDSINSLRLILKLPKMINAMQAYHEIVNKLEEQERKLATNHFQGELSV